MSVFVSRKVRRNILIVFYVLNFPSGRDWSVSQSGATEAGPQEIPPRRPEPGGRTSAHRAVSYPRQICSEVSQTFFFFN